MGFTARTCLGGIGGEGAVETAASKATDEMRVVELSRALLACGRENRTTIIHNSAENTRIVEASLEVVRRIESALRQIFPAHGTAFDHMLALVGLLAEANNGPLKLRALRVFLESLR